tara:strand:+ start:84 stop:395 length:312 start_codon:yes stop_codon:yes gene_type:complete
MRYTEKVNKIYAIAKKEGEDLRVELIDKIEKYLKGMIKITPLNNVKSPINLEGIDTFLFLKTMTSSGDVHYIAPIYRDSNAYTDNYKDMTVMPLATICDFLNL